MGLPTSDELGQDPSPQLPEPTLNAQPSQHQSSEGFVMIQVQNNDIPERTQRPSRSAWTRPNLFAQDSSASMAHGISSPSSRARQSRTRRYKLSLAIFKLVFVLALLGLTIAGYVESLRHAQRAAASSETQHTPQPMPAQAEAHSELPSTSVQQDSDSTSITSSPAFIHALFIIAIIIELLGLWRAIISFMRARSSSDPVQTDFGDPEESPSITSRRSPLARFFLGVPSPRPTPVLPSYEQSLKQAARQTARRQAQQAGVSAGRRGREVYGTGDPEDLEVQRILRMGGLPPNYRSSDMRKSTVLLRGARPERRLSIASLFSSTESSPPTPNRIASLLRRLSDRFSLSDPEPAEEEHQPDKRENKCASMNDKEIASLAANLPLPSSPASRPKPKKKFSSASRKKYEPTKDTVQEETELETLPASETPLDGRKPHAEI